MLPRKTNFGRPEGARELGLEVGEHAEPGLERLAALQVVGVLPLPAEALALGAARRRSSRSRGGQALELGDG